MDARFGTRVGVRGATDALRVLSFASGASPSSHPPPSSASLRLMTPRVFDSLPRLCFDCRSIRQTRFLAPHVLLRCSSSHGERQVRSNTRRTRDGSLAGCALRQAAGLSFISISNPYEIATECPAGAVQSASEDQFADGCCEPIVTGLWSIALRSVLRHRLLVW